MSLQGIQATSVATTVLMAIAEVLSLSSVSLGQELLAESDVAPTTNSAPLARDLTPLNPDPSLLDVPTQDKQVTIDLNQPITLEEAQILARRNNRDIQQAKLQVQVVRSQLQQTKAALLPVTQAEAELRRTDNDLFGEANNPLAPPSVSNIFDADIELSYSAFSSGQRSASIRAATAALKAAEDALETALQDLRFTVTDNYYDLQQADELVNIAQASVDNAERNLVNAQALFDAGLEAKFDVLQAEVQLSDLKQQLEEALGQQVIARRQLSQTLSVKPTVTLMAADPIEITETLDMTLEQSIVLALQNRSELAEILEQRRVAQQNLRLVRGQFGPQVTVSASPSYVENLGDNASGQVGYALGGRVSKLIFNGGLTKAQAKEEQLNIQIAENQYLDFQDLIRFQVTQNFATLQSSEKNIQTNTDAVMQAERSLDIANERFSAGIGTQLEVSNSETDLTRARSNLLSAKIDYKRALASLERFVGHRGIPISRDQPPP